MAKRLAAKDSPPLPASHARGVAPLAFRLLALLLLSAASFAAPAVAQEPPTPHDAPDLRGEWALETVRTKEGKTYYGYIQSIGPKEIELVEVHRPPGRTMFLVVRTLPAESVSKLDRLPEEARRQLEERIGRFERRLAIEAGAIDQVELTPTTLDEQPAFAYEGPWFHLIGAGEENTIRRGVVRIEQIFRAYRHALPPRRQPRDRLRVILYGSMEQYRRYLYSQRLEIDHPAFYSATSNTIVAGADLPSYAEQLERVRAENERLREQYKALDRDFGTRQSAMKEQLKKAGFNGDEISEEMRARDKAWKAEYDAMTARLNEADRRNQRRFEQVSGQLYARLRHEAFHAYVENYLFPQRDYAFPRWLNEGLAQVFETAVLDGETLRIDAPDRELLQRLRADLMSGEPLPLAELLISGDDAFLNTHARAGAAQRRYLYSWGVAWRLLFRRDLARDEALGKFVALEAASLSPIERFEQLIGMKLPDFEQQWRETILNPTPAPR